MSKRTLLVITVVLTVLVVAETGWVLYRTLKGQPTEAWGIALVLPWMWAMKKLTATAPETTTGAEG